MPLWNVPLLRELDGKQGEEVKGTVGGQLEGKGDELKCREGS